MFLTLDTSLLRILFAAFLTYKIYFDWTSISIPNERYIPFENSSSPPQVPPYEFTSVVSLVFEMPNIEANGWNGGHNLSQLQLVQNRSLTSCLGDDPSTNQGHWPTMLVDVEGFLVGGWLNQPLLKNITVVKMGEFFSQFWGWFFTNLQ